MKKICILISVFLLVFAVSVFADSPIKVLINDEYISFADENGNVVNPELVNDRTMVPLRRIFNELGAQVDWDDATQTVIAVKGGKVIKLTIGSNIAYVTENGKQTTITLDAKPYITNDRTLVPLRFVSETFDSLVGWDQDSNTAIIVKIDELTQQLESKCSNFIEYTQTVKNAEKNMKMSGNIVFDGEGEGVKEAFAQIKPSIKFDIIANEYQMYFNLPEGILANDEQTNAQLAKTYILLDLSEIIDYSNEVTNVSKVVEDFGGEVTLTTYKELKESLDMVSELISNDNFKITKNGNKTTYTLAIKDYEYYDAESGMTMLISMDMSMPTTNDVADSMYMKVKVAPKGENMYISITLDTDVDYSATKYTIPADAEVVDLIETILSLIIMNQQTI